MAEKKKDIPDSHLTFPIFGIMRPVDDLVASSAQNLEDHRGRVALWGAHVIRPLLDESVD